MSRRRQAGWRRARDGATYDAFISYSHAADGKLAPALQSGLQQLARPFLRPRALRVFRDKTSLSASPHLWSSIEDALLGSNYFLLLSEDVRQQRRARRVFRILMAMLVVALVLVSTNLILVNKLLTQPRGSATITMTGDIEGTWRFHFLSELPLEDHHEISWQGDGVDRVGDRLLVIGSSTGSFAGTRTTTSGPWPYGLNGEPAIYLAITPGVGGCPSYECVLETTDGGPFDEVVNTCAITIYGWDESFISGSFECDDMRATDDFVGESLGLEVDVSGQFSAQLG